MRPRWQLADAARALKPLRQGELDGLCGLYAIINAVRLAVFPRRLRKPEVKVLFEAGLKVLSKTKRLRHIVTDGLEDPIWKRMVAAVLERVALEHGEQLILDDLIDYQVRTMADAHRAIRHALHGGAPTLITLNRSYDHWTVFSGYTKQRYYLFDSWGYRWVGTENIVLSDSEEDAAHGLGQALSLRPKD